jgi:hypothetical protein
MSDSEKSASELKSARQRRRAPVIELKAEEIPGAETPSEPVATAAVVSETSTPGDPAPPPPEAPEPEAQAEPKGPEVTPEPLFVPPPPVSKPGLGIPLAAAALAGALFGGIGGSIAPRFFSAGPVPDSARLGGVERTQQDLAKQLPALANKAELEALRQSLTRIEGDVSKRISDASGPISQKVSGLEAEIKAVASRAAPSAGPSAPPPPPVDLSPLQQRIAALETQLKALDTKADAAAKAADPRLTALDQKLEQASRRIDAGSAAPLFAATQALAQAFHRGAPFTNEIAAAEVLGAKPEQLLPLKPLAAKGAPTAQSLAASFAPLASKLAGTADQGGVRGFLQRFVSVRPTSESAGDMPPALVSTIEASLKRGDVASALAAWGKLPEPARAASANWAAEASGQDKAAKALAALQDAVTAALRK